MKDIITRGMEIRPCELLIFLLYAIYHGLRDLKTDNTYKKLDPGSVLIEPSARTTLTIL